VRLRFLGTGTSFGIPVIGCDCETCTSPDLRDRRTRHGAIVESDDGARRLLIDTPPELRLQLLQAGVRRIDAVWFTHCHADHVHGIDDLRAFAMRPEEQLTAYAGPECARILQTKFDYIFDASQRPLPGTSKPELRLETFRDNQPVQVAGFQVLPLAVPHGSVHVYGFRIGALGYITDAKQLPDGVIDALRGVRVLVLNALWRGKPHPTHFTVEEAVTAAARIGAERTFLTHLTHRVRHAELLDSLPPGVEPAYDGLVVEI
jgi:phosphoribosyl 1,2-cyclic phosphate phosphodiesterase